MKKINGKLYDFSFPPGSTRLYWYDLTAKEQQICDQFEKIQKQYAPHVPPVDVLERMGPLFDAMQQVLMRRAVDFFAHLVGELIYMGHDPKHVEHDIKLLEVMLWHFIFRALRNRQDEDAFDRGVLETFDHNDWDRLPDTEADPLDSRWVQVDVIMDAYHAEQKRKDEARERREREEWKQRIKNEK